MGLMVSPIKRSVFRPDQNYALNSQLLMLLWQLEQSLISVPCHLKEEEVFRIFGGF